MPHTALVRDVMHRDVVTVRPDRTLRDLLAVLARHRISGAPVVDGSGAILGVVSMRDVGEFLIHQLEVPLALFVEGTGADDDDGEDAYHPYLATPDGLAVIPEDDGLDGYTVREIMTPAVFSVAPDDEIAEAAAFMLRGRIHRALVTEEERLVGIVTPLDLLQVVAADRDAALATAE